MAVCSKCGGFKKLMARSSDGCGIRQVDCPCTQTATPGREINQHTVNYPPEVLAALRQAGSLRDSVLNASANLQQR